MCLTVGRWVSTEGLQPPFRSFKVHYDPDAQVRWLRSDPILQSETSLTFRSHDSVVSCGVKCRGSRRIVINNMYAMTPGTSNTSEDTEVGGGVKKFYRRELRLLQKEPHTKDTEGERVEGRLRTNESHDGFVFFHVPITDSAPQSRVTSTRLWSLVVGLPGECLEHTDTSNCTDVVAPSTGPDRSGGCVRSRTHRLQKIQYCDPWSHLRLSPGQTTPTRH